MRVIAIYLLIINAAGFLVMTIDKLYAKKNMWRVPERTLLGVAAGALGIGKWVLGSAVGQLVSSTIAFVTAPVSGLILITVGYELSFRKSMIKPVMVTVGLRIAVMAVLVLLGAGVIFSIVPFDKELFVALMLGYALPAPFIIPLFADLGKDGEYVSTALSMETIASLILFVGIAAYTLA